MINTAKLDLGTEIFEGARIPRIALLYSSEILYMHGVQTFTFYAVHCTMSLCKLACSHC